MWEKIDDADDDQGSNAPLGVFLGVLGLELGLEVARPSGAGLHIFDPSGGPRDKYSQTAP